ncbi:type II secretion system protein GspK [Luteimonas sp. MC1828]|uniref:general secretion pathway protein GspK n=1 Tax=Luteimonas sp. MC1828 TaxID=2799787 RepID=UPI0018F19A79|nr:type II secretion system protein GspK [Luteimonas sp. MC1828]MBJ7576009.1 general secretion pathway protein GspK [Luteimonas sp. MC1828]
MGRQRGVALVLVMWLVALLAALVGAYATTARIEYMQGRVLHGAVVAESAARAGLEYALVRLQDQEPRRAWQADGRSYRWRYGGADVELRILDESAKIDLNAADVMLLAGLFRTLGVEPSQADAVAAAIVDWRDSDSLTQASGGAEDGQYAAAGLPYGAKDAPFDTIAEVEQVLGMTPALYALAAPHLTVFSGLEKPDERFASAEVLGALGIDPAMTLALREAGGEALAESLRGGGSGTYSIDSRARLADGRQAVLRAVVRAGGSGVPGSAYTPLRWEEGATPR